MASNEPKTVPAWIFKLALPKTQKIQFEGIFKNVDQSTQDTFSKISQTRDEVRYQLEVDSLQGSISAIEKYMPGFFGLVEAAEQLPPDFTKWLKILWTTPIGIRYSAVPFSGSAFRFEVIMCLLAYGIGFRNQANEILQGLSSTAPDFDEKSKNAATLLCKAAGVFEHVSQVELPKWKGKPDTHLPEWMDETFLALSSVCIAEAQEITVKKGFLKGTSGSALSKLCVDIFQKFEHAQGLLKKMLCADQVIPPLLTYLQLNAIMWKAISFKLIAEDYYNKGEYGNAVAYINAASAVLIEKKDPLLEMFLGLYNIEKDIIKQIAAKYSHENDTIYYDKVAVEVSVPDAKCLMKVTPFQAPQSLAIQIVQTKGTECLIQ